MKSLTQQDQNLLFGRAEVVREIVANCRAERLSLITSEPGMGVTSLLQAGIAPALQREGFIVALFSDWQGRSFVTSLREAVADAVRDSGHPDFYAQGEPLHELVAHITSRTGTPLAVLFDQFEDYVRCHSNSELSDSFDSELAHTVAARKAAFVIGLQDHAVPAFDRLHQHIPNLRGFEFKLTPLSEPSARETIQAEASANDQSVDSAVIDAIVASPVIRTDEGTVHPFFLNVATSVFMETEKRRNSPTLTMATVETLGGVDRVVLEYLDHRVADFGTTQKELLFRWCNLLISPEKRRVAVTEKGLTDYAGKLNRFVAPLLDRLIELEILRTVDTAGVIRYEIARDCYTPILRDWWERREAELIARRRATFRIRSLSVAAGAILAMYIVWLIFSK